MATAILGSSMLDHVAEVSSTVTEREVGVIAAETQSLETADQLAHAFNKTNYIFFEYLGVRIFGLETRIFIQTYNKLDISEQI